MKKKIEIERMYIPEIAEADILDTIQKAKQIVRSTQIKKQETSILKTMQQVIRLQGWRSLGIQALVVLCMLYFVWIEIDLGLDIAPYSLLIVSGAIMSIAACSEMLRGDIYQMWELESACAISRQRLFIWKMMLLDIFSIIGIVAISFILANRYDLELFSLIAGGCIPFLFLNAIALQFQVYIQSFSIFLCLYGSALCLMFLLGFIFHIEPSFLYTLQRMGSIFLLITITYTFTLIVYQYKKEQFI